MMIIMAGKSKLSPLTIASEDKKKLETLRMSRTAPLREVQRAKILLHHLAGDNPSTIQKIVGVSRVTIYHCLHKAIEMGVAAALKDTYHRPKEPVILQTHQKTTLQKPEFK